MPGVSGSEGLCVGGSTGGTDPHGHSSAATPRYLTGERGQPSASLAAVPRLGRLPGSPHASLGIDTSEHPEPRGRWMV